MAKSVQPFTWERGFQEPSTGAPWQYQPSSDDEDDCYVTPPSKEMVTSERHNQLGINVLRTWPTLYDGTNNPHGIPEWWKPSNEVDVLICGGKSFQKFLKLIEQQSRLTKRSWSKWTGSCSQSCETASLVPHHWSVIHAFKTSDIMSYMNTDKAEGPLIAGRADGVQPRFLEILNTWGLAKEVHEEGPLIERTAIYKDGKKLLFDRSHQCDSRYRGLHIITQGQVERIYIRDLMRHRVIVERNSTLSKFHVENTGSHPVHMSVVNVKTGQEEQVRAKFLVGSDGAASMVRKGLGIQFDGVSTDIYWGIMDCIFKTDYPHAWVFG